ncbi:MAG: MotA/TolQ/ExbB proton channel family protein [Veillonella sp.]|uniref:MotA/TolQ/ExbB proton channel family protein n=1 Tax=Veillonella sp. TaxID=1926307 RepID=UPI001EBC71C9|nr:MotA/TolQ/ExbB proton channel family protein [Veillonella sp.]MBS5270692.1 MotA/TolQ/ExbB proton channel family protein [Veillonella sp.]
MEHIIHLFNAGGLVMYPLLIFLIASWTIGIERIRLYRQFSQTLSQLKTVTEYDQENKAWSALLNQLESLDNNIVGHLVMSMKAARNYLNLTNRLEDTVTIVDMDLKRGLNWLSMMVTMAPLLGLLGTVVGMIRSFAAVGGDIGAPTVITGGVSEALIATVTGLTVAIIALFFHSYCAYKVNTFIARLEQSFGNILDVYNRSHSL